MPIDATQIPELLTPSQVAELAGGGITRQAVWAACTEGRLEATRVGEGWAIPRAAAEAYVLALKADAEADVTRLKKKLGRAQARARRIKPRTSKRGGRS